MTAKERTCACASDDAHECMRRRYPTPYPIDDQDAEYEYDDEECQCGCHDQREEDDYE